MLSLAASSIIEIDDRGYVYAGKDIINHNLLDMDIPQYVDDKEVLGIRERGFSGYTNIRSVNLPSSILEIEAEAFSDCDSLENINIPNNTSAIGSKAFCGCISLKDVIIPFSVERIGDRAFWGCSNLESVLMARHDMKYVWYKGCSQCDDNPPKAEF